MRDRPLLAIALLGAAVTFLLLRPASVPGGAETDETPVHPASINVDPFGMPTDDLSMVEAMVERNQTFSD